ncbi:MAG: bifunctional 4-hydroxy-2-oxoglutarate aldolase/2-dehydro-3-deoxy-phosphogluconate aldolase [Bacteroidales bacterium]
MTKFRRLQVAQKMYESGVIPVFYHPDAATGKKILDACYEGGLRVFEFTNRGDFAHEVFGELSRYVSSVYDDLILGTGSVMDAPTAALYIQMGSNFIVSPVLKEDMAHVCNRRKILWSPGCGSLTEISRAEELGAEIVKIFPAREIGGPTFIKSILGPMPWSNIMPTGGVNPTEESIKEWFEAGAYCVGMGSKLIRKDLI